MAKTARTLTTPATNIEITVTQSRDCLARLFGSAPSTLLLLKIKPSFSRAPQNTRRLPDCSRDSDRQSAKIICSQAQIPVLPHLYDGLGSGLLPMFSSRPPGVRVFDGEAVLVELRWVRCNQASETLTCRVNNVQITIGAVIPAQANIRAGGLFSGGLGSPSNYNFHWTSIQAYEDLSLNRGKHTLKFGVGLERIRDNMLAVSDTGGVFSFNSLSDFLTNVPFFL